MDPHSPEFQRAEALDQIFHLIGSNTRGKQVLSTMLSTHLSMPDKALDKLLSEETKIFKQLSNSVSRMAYGDNPTMVQLTPFGEQQYKAGWTFMNQLALDELDEAQKKKQAMKKQKWSWIPKAGSFILGSTTILFAYLTWDATRENKVHNEKEERWEQEKMQMQFQIDKLTKKYNSIPDSIRAKYDSN